MTEKIRIKDFSNPETSIYNMRSETALYRMNEPEPGLFIAETELIIRRALSAGFEPVSILVAESELENMSGLIEECEKRIVTADRDAVGDVSVKQSNPASDKTFPIYYADYDTIKNLIGFPLTRGVLCALRRKRIPDLEGILKSAKNIAILCDIENPTNIGTIFRNAAALNIDAVILYGNCSDPLYRRSLRAGMGCQFVIPWTSCEALLKQAKADYYSNINSGIKILKKIKDEGFHFAAFALRNDSLTLSEFASKPTEKKALLLGNEGYGLPDEILNLCDSVIKIPMRESVDSLNVAVASGIAFYELTK